MVNTLSGSVSAYRKEIVKPRFIRIDEVMALLDVTRDEAMDIASIGDEVMITDKNGQKHIYEVTETEVVNPYDNSIKTQGDEKELTLFTCSQKGTMRFVVRCIYKEAVMDE